MSHQCVRCDTMYKDGASELLKGCSKCKGKFFFFIKKEALEKAKKIEIKLSQKERKQIQTDVLNLIGEEAKDRPVILDLENIRVLKPGQYEIDLVDLFRGKPLVYKLEEGKYIIDLASTFKSETLE